MEAEGRAMHGAIAEKSCCSEMCLDSRFLPLVGMTLYVEVNLQISKSRITCDRLIVILFYLFISPQKLLS